MVLSLQAVAFFVFASSRPRTAPTRRCEYLAAEAVHPLWHRWPSLPVCCSPAGSLRSPEASWPPACRPGVSLLPGCGVLSAGCWPAWNSAQARRPESPAELLCLCPLMLPAGRERPVGDSPYAGLQLCGAGAGAQATCAVWFPLRGSCSEAPGPMCAVGWIAATSLKCLLLHPLPALCRVQGASSSPAEVGPPP